MTGSSASSERGREGERRTAEGDEDEERAGHHLLGDVLGRRERRKGLAERDRVDLEEEDEGKVVPGPRRVRAEADRVVCEREGVRERVSQGSVRGAREGEEREGASDAQKRRKNVTAHSTEYGISPMSCVRPKTTGEYILELDSRTKVVRLWMKSGSTWAMRMAGSVTR